jgi:NAD(P)H-dependent FMN reductase
VRDGAEPPLGAFRNRVFALAAASPGTLGGYRSLMALRQVLELGCGATVLPEQVAVRDAANAFDDDDNLRDPRTAQALAALLRRLVDAARYLH